MSTTTRTKEYVESLWRATIEDARRRFQRLEERGGEVWFCILDGHRSSRVWNWHELPSHLLHRLGFPEDICRNSAPTFSFGERLIPAESSALICKREGTYGVPLRNAKPTGTKGVPEDSPKVPKAKDVACPCHGVERTDHRRWAVFIYGDRASHRQFAELSRDLWRPLIRIVDGIGGLPSDTRECITDILRRCDGSWCDACWPMTVGAFACVNVDYRTWMRTSPLEARRYSCVGDKVEAYRCRPVQHLEPPVDSVIDERIPLDVFEGLGATGARFENRSASGEIAWTQTLLPQDHFFTSALNAARASVQVLNILMSARSELPIRPHSNVKGHGRTSAGVEDRSLDDDDRFNRCRARTQAHADAFRVLARPVMCEVDPGRGDGAPIAAKDAPNDRWEPPPDYVSSSDIMNAERFQKNGKNPPRTTIQKWEMRHGTSVVKAPDTGESHYLESWVMDRISEWAPRQPRN